MADQRPDLLQIVVLVLSVYVLAALMIDTFIVLPMEISHLLTFIDNCICGFFLVDFSIRFYRAENKLSFMKWGWIDLLSSIPTLDMLRAGRLVRLVRLIRLLRAFRSTRHLVNFIFQSKLKGVLTSAILIAVLMIIFSSVAILQVEKDADGNIKTAEDAIWWAYVTITTVGYGDKFPVTSEGRIIAAVLMTVGVGLLGTFTAYVASLFVNDKNRESVDRK